jgi:hypothetical protein
MSLDKSPKHLPDDPQDIAHKLMVQRELMSKWRAEHPGGSKRENDGAWVAPTGPAEIYDTYTLTDQGKAHVKDIAFDPDAESKQGKVRDLYRKITDLL